MRRPDPRSLLLAVVAGLILATAAFVSWRRTSVEKIPALPAETNAWPADSYQDDAYLAWPSNAPPELKIRGSRVNRASEYQGSFTSGWFAARPLVGLLVAGFPKLPGNSLALELRDANGRTTSLAFSPVNPGECWQPWRVTLPAGITAFRVHAGDGRTDFNGWLAFTDPFVPDVRPVFLPQVPRTFLALGVQAVLFLLLGVPIARGLASKEIVPPPLIPLLSGATIALLGYIAFWIYFAHPLAGRVFTWIGLLVSGVLPFFIRTDSPRGSGLRQPLFLAATIAVFYLSLLLLYEPTRFSFTAANRFDENLPSDNEIPRAFADRLWSGQSPRELWGDWQSSDRPPLQAGWQLLTWPVLQALGFDLDVAANTAGVCFQLLWVFALWALVRHFGASPRQALGVVAGVAFSGVLLEFSVFVWPKLGSAALMLAAYLLWCPEAPEQMRRQFALGGVCAALAWLAHGGVAFSLLGLAPLAWLWRRRVRFSDWLIAGAAFGVLAMPWMAYQKFYEPPGNRLLKWHLGGEMDIDRRGALEAIVDGYRKAGVATALHHKWTNLRLQFEGHWPRPRDFDFSLRSAALRDGEAYYTARGFCFWILALLAPLLWLLHISPTPPPRVRRSLLEALLWLVTGFMVWLGLMFQPNSATIHQGTLVTQLLGTALLAFGAFLLNRWFFAALATFQALWFALAWIPPSRLVDGGTLAFPAALAGVTGALLFVQIWRGAASGKLLDNAA